MALLYLVCKRTLFYRAMGIAAWHTQFTAKISASAVMPYFNAVLAWEDKTLISAELVGMKA
jgi:hypothetical protein